MSRKPVPIDLDELEKLAAMHCTEAEVAAWFSTPGQSISQQAISKRLQKEPLKSTWAAGWAKGNISLRRTQKQQADNGNATMLIWLGKQWLGQTDTSRVQHSGEIAVTGALKRLEEEIACVLAEAERATAE